jgi:aldose 1-epimerase
MMSDLKINSKPVLLRSAAAECEIWPALGGSIGRWTISGQEMFRRAIVTADASWSPLDMASFPLVPFSNRIGFGQFAWAGRPVEIVANFPPEPHAIHGTGWTAAWEIAGLTVDTLVLRHSHAESPQWPWAFEAEQHITLTSNALALRLVARNLANEPVPLAFGHHPYFDSKGATLSFSADTVWRTGADGLPSCAETPEGNFDFTTDAPIEGRALDNGFAGWDGKAHIRWQGRPLYLEIDADMQAAVVYVPIDGDSFCFEPVPHIINALNMPGELPQMPVVAPGKGAEMLIHFAAKSA